MKKFAIVIIGILLIVGLVACGGKSDSSQVSEASKPSEAGEPSEAGKPSEAGEPSEASKPSEASDAAAEKNPYNLDYESDLFQPMSEDKKASAKTLKETATELIEEDSIFVRSKYADYTYEDVAEHIGVDATQYFYNDQWPGREYIWYADDDSVSLFLVFAESGGVWKLAAMTVDPFD